MMIRERLSSAGSRLPVPVLLLCPHAGLRFVKEQQRALSMTTATTMNPDSGAVEVAQRIESRTRWPRLSAVAICAQDGWGGAGFGSDGSKQGGSPPCFCTSARETYGCSSTFGYF